MKVFPMRCFLQSSFEPKEEIGSKIQKFFQSVTLNYLNSHLPLLRHCLVSSFIKTALKQDNTFYLYFFKTKLKTTNS